MPYTGLRVARRGPNQDDITGSERHWRLAAHRRRLRGNRLPRIFDGPPPAMRNRWVRHPTATRRELAPLTGCRGPTPAGGQCDRCDSRSFQIIIMTCANKSRETTPKALHGGGSTALGYGRLSSLVQLGGAESRATRKVDIGAFLKQADVKATAQLSMAQAASFVSGARLATR